MIFEGKVFAPARGSRYWEVKIPQLGVFTQGRSERNAYAMAADALETLVGEKRFRVQIVPLDGGRFLIRANDLRPLIARWLFRLRADKGLSLREAAARMGSPPPKPGHAMRAAALRHGREAIRVDPRLGSGGGFHAEKSHDARIEKDWLTVGITMRFD